MKSHTSQAKRFALLWQDVLTSADLTSLRYSRNHWGDTLQVFHILHSRVTRVETLVVNELGETMIVRKVCADSRNRCGAQGRRALKYQDKEEECKLLLRDCSQS